MGYDVKGDSVSDTTMQCLARRLFNKYMFSPSPLPPLYLFSPAQLKQAMRLRPRSLLLQIRVLPARPIRALAAKGED